MPVHATALYLVIVPALANLIASPAAMIIAPAMILHNVGSALKRYTIAATKLIWSLYVFFRAIIDYPKYCYSASVSRYSAYPDKMK